MLNLLFFVAGDPDGGSSPFISFIFIGLIFLIFWLFIIRPQSKRQKEIERKVGEMKKGDKVVTSGGVIGTLHTTEDDSILIEVDKDVKIRILKNAIVDVNPNKK